MIIIKGKYLNDSEIVLHLSKSFDGCLLFFLLSTRTGWGNEEGLRSKQYLENLVCLSDV